MISAMTQLGGEREFAGFGDPELCGYGFGAATGACKERKPGKGSATIRRVQTALRGLAQRTRDPRVNVVADGLPGPKTVAAVNYAIPKYVAAPAAYATGALTKPQVISLAPQLAAYIEKGPNRIEGKVSTEFQPNLPAAAQPAYTPASGGSTMPYPPPPAQYYPPGYVPASSYPGYATPREASVDVRTFIPAQYEHVHFNPVTVALVIGVGVAAVMVGQRRGEARK